MYIYLSSITQLSHKLRFGDLQLAPKTINSIKSGKCFYPPSPIFRGTFFNILDNLGKAALPTK